MCIACLSLILFFPKGRLSGDQPDRCQPRHRHGCLLESLPRCPGGVSRLPLRPEEEVPRLPDGDRQHAGEEDL